MINKSNNTITNECGNKNDHENNNERNHKIF